MHTMPHSECCLLLQSELCASRYESFKRFNSGLASFVIGWLKEWNMELSNFFYLSYLKAVSKKIRDVLASH
eukprot:scaffold17114_cov57-Skeletonema_menzelii.AAC.1